MSERRVDVYVMKGYMLPFVDGPNMLEKTPLHHMNAPNDIRLSTRDAVARCCVATRVTLLWVYFRAVGFQLE